MDIHSRKIAFVQEFLKLQSEEAIGRLEKLLKKEKRASDPNPHEVMTRDELDKRIDQSEADFENNRFKSSAEVASKAGA